MANSKIKQILVGQTTYDIEDASAAHKASDNTFTGTNTFSNAITAKQGIISTNGDNLLDKAKLNYNSISRHTNNNDYTLTIPTKNGTLATTGDIPTVIANPTASGTVTLTKLKVGSTVYNIPSGGGSTAGVLSFGGKTGYITLSDGLSMNNNQLVSKIKNIYTDASGYLCIETNE